MDDIEIRLLCMTDLHTAALQKFNRYQVTNRVLRKENDRYYYKDDHFIESWDEQKKEQVVQSLHQCILAGGIVAGAFADGNLVGFANIERNFFGTDNEYLELSYIHVSYEYRRHGIGRRLFSLCCKYAKELGAKKLYIAAHPSVETQSFYKSMGCTFAVEINKEILAKEPLDIQMEFVL